MKEYCFLIECDEGNYNYWMAFACWYSIKLNIPNSKIYLSKRNNWKWTQKVEINYLNKNNNIKDFDLVLSPSMVAVRPIENNEITVSSSKSDVFSNFVEYKYGCGKLKLDSSAPPFDNVFKNNLKEDITVNEKAVLNIFQKCSNLYKALEGLI